ncbi:hypothetical protein BHYA_0154g00150 [Botrytis hyacinthi]|uniref:Uncharacterized protein n=1 Tax=Botrytis hyacinthi TaxID=278943 RepID=A0A4Z1GP54_9HELO|nr:hypothetical protein BHYA_0154g00150 [Botrytis hyacinthi]
MVRARTHAYLLQYTLHGVPVRDVGEGLEETFDGSSSSFPQSSTVTTSAATTITTNFTATTTNNLTATATNNLPVRPATDNNLLPTNPPQPLLTSTPLARVNTMSYDEARTAMFRAHVIGAPISLDAIRIFFDNRFNQEELLYEMCMLFGIRPKEENLFITMVLLYVFAFFCRILPHVL